MLDSSARLPAVRPTPRTTPSIKLAKAFLGLTLGIALAIFVTIAADRVVGLVRPAHQVSSGLLFPPNSRAVHRTSEFTYVAQTSSIGIRDHEYAAAHPGVVRMAVIGDSFTYGWGVSPEEGWVKLVEDELHRRGRTDVEIVNLGLPNGYPVQYPEILANAMPQLAPDIVIVAVLEGDDLAQYIVEAEPRPDDSVRSQTSVETLWRRCQLSCLNLAAAGVRRVYPNVLRFMANADELDLGREWQSEATAFHARMDPETRRRFDAIDPKVADAFLRGDLNPGLVTLALRHPRYFAYTLDLDAEVTRAAIDRMADAFRRMKATVDANGSTMAVVSVPYRAYMSDADQGALRRIGFATRPEMLSSTAQDEAIAVAAAQSHVPVLTATDDFRRESQAAGALYFTLDGHFTARGNQTFATLIHAKIEQLLNR